MYLLDKRVSFFAPQNGSSDLLTFILPKRLLHNCKKVSCYLGLSTWRAIGWSIGVSDKCTRFAVLVACAERFEAYKT